MTLRHAVQLRRGRTPPRHPRWPDQRRLPAQAVRVQGREGLPLRAIQGNPKSAVYFDANLEDRGYLIELGGRTFLQPGDSVLLEDHLFLKYVDVLFFSPTEHNMHIEFSVILIDELDPAYILPQHRDTYRVTPENRYWTSGYPQEVGVRLSRPLQARYHILKQGQRLEIERASGDEGRGKDGDHLGPRG